MVSCVRLTAFFRPSTGSAGSVWRSRSPNAPTVLQVLQRCRRASGPRSRAGGPSRRVAARRSRRRPASPGPSRTRRASSAAAGPWTVQDANTGHHSAGDKSSWCPELDSRAAHRAPATLISPHQLLQNRVSSACLSWATCVVRDAKHGAPVSGRRPAAGVPNWSLGPRTAASSAGGRGARISCSQVASTPAATARRRPERNHASALEGRTARGWSGGKRFCGAGGELFCPHRGRRPGTRRSSAPGRCRCPPTSAACCPPPGPGVPPGG